MRFFGGTRSHPERRRQAKLKGDLAAYSAFRVDDNLRVLFRWDADVCFLVTLGTHDEVY